jgi:hypothetical protein
MCHIDRKETLPVDEAHVPCQLEGNPSIQRGTFTLLAAPSNFPYASGVYLKIPAKAEGYPPADADGSFPGKRSRISRCTGAISTVFLSFLSFQSNQSIDQSKIVET